MNPSPENNKQLSDRQLPVMAGYDRRLDLTPTFLGKTSNCCPKIVDELIHLLLTNSFVEQLILCNCGIGDSEISSLSTVFPDNTFIKILDLSRNHIGSIGVKNLKDTLICTENVQILDMSRNIIDDKSFSDLFRLPNLTCLNLEYNIISLEQVPISYPVSSSIVELFLGHNNIGHKGAIALAEILPSMDIKYLNLDYNKIGDIGASAIANATTLTPSLERLHLIYNNIDKIGMLAIAKMLTNSPFLLELNISYNKFDTSIDSLMFARDENTTLLVLTCEPYNMDCYFSRKLICSKGLKRNYTLRSNEFLTPLNLLRMPESARNAIIVTFLASMCETGQSILPTRVWVIIFNFWKRKDWKKSGLYD